MILSRPARLPGMATIVCIPGAGGRPADWEPVAGHLRDLGHDVLAVDLPNDDETAGLDAYVQAVVEQVGDRRDDLVVVAQSMGGLTAPLVAAQLPVELIVLVAAMVLLPGETGGEWWGNTGHEAAVDAQGLTDTSEEAMFLHDVPAELLATLEPPRDQSERPFADPMPLEAWPDVPTRFLLCADDRFFPAEWMRGIVRERLGIEADEIPGSHCAYLSRPQELAAAIHRSWTELPT